VHVVGSGSLKTKRGGERGPTGKKRNGARPMEKSFQEEAFFGKKGMGGGNEMFANEENRQPQGTKLSRLIRPCDAEKGIKEGVHSEGDGGGTERQWEEAITGVVGVERDHLVLKGKKIPYPGPMKPTLVY